MKTQNKELREKIANKLRVHGLICMNEICKLKLDCTIDYELHDLFQSELDQKFQEIFGKFKRI